MFCLRHYGQDAQGRRTTINYFSTRAESGATAGGEGAVAQTSTTTVRTIISGDVGDVGEGGGGAGDDAAVRTIEGFDGVALDAEAQAAIQAALEDYAERRRGADANIAQGGELAVLQQLADPNVTFVRVHDELEAAGAVLEP